LISDHVQQKFQDNKNDKTKECFDTDLDKDYTTAILALPNDNNDRYIKYDLLDEFYSKGDNYKVYAKGIADKISKSSLKDNVKPEMGGFAAFGVDKKAAEKDDKKKDQMEIKGDKDAANKIKGIFGSIGGAAEDSKDEEEGESPKDLLTQLKEGIEFNFHLLRQKTDEENKSKVGRRGTITIPPEEIKMFNKLVSDFIKQFDKIALKKVVVSSLKTLRIFLIEKNGSSKLQQLKAKTNSSNIDLLDFWKANDSKEMDLTFETKEEKYIW